jgi:hypothetical protein
VRIVGYIEDLPPRRWGKWMPKADERGLFLMLFCSKLYALDEQRQLLLKRKIK